MVQSASPPFRLSTLGRVELSIVGAPTPPEARRPRLLALLALSSSNGIHGIRREAAAAALWPEASEAQARNDLKQLVFVARRTLSPGLFTDDPTSLIVNNDVLWSDVVHFHRAWESLQLQNAVTLYQGPFLDGFRIPDRPEFERLVEVERSRCATRYAHALETLAAEAEARGDYATAVTWWQHLIAEEPLRDGYAMGFMGALAASGELSGALSYARRYQRLLRQELDVDLSPALVRFVESLPLRTPAGATTRHSILNLVGIGRAVGARHRDLPGTPARAL